MRRGEVIFNGMAIIGIVFFGVLFYPLVRAEATGTLARPGVNTTSVGSEAPIPQPLAPSAGEKQPPLSFANILSASKAVLGVTATSLTYAVHLPKIVYLPIKHGVSAFNFVLKTSLRPLDPILAPVYLALRIIFTPILVPVLLAYKFAVLVYPLYVFLGAAIICGALAGLLSRVLGTVIVRNVLGIRSRSQARPVEEKPAAGRRMSRSRTLAR